MIEPARLRTMPQCDALSHRLGELERCHDAAGVASWELDLVSSTVMWSTNCAAVFGYEVQGGCSLDRWMETVHADDRKLLRAGLRKAMADGSGAAKLVQQDVRVTLADGSTRWVQVRGSVVADATGRHSRFLGIALDATARKAEEAELRRAYRAKNEFLASVSHEVRNPLTVILGFVDLLARPDTSDANRAIFRSVIRRNGEQMSQILEDALDLTRAEAGEFAVELASVHLPELLTDVVTAFHGLAKEKHLSFVMTSDGPVPERFITDPVRLHQILQNVIGNAVKYTERGSVMVVVRQKEKPEDGTLLLEFTVRDTGIGISGEDASKLFEPFARAESLPRRRFKGTGLGLALARRLARALGGDVALTHSAPGLGSTFVVTIAAAHQSQSIRPLPIRRPRTNSKVIWND